jgi:23S rRNA-/tRNA-specific pseudouridylate synthase
MGTQLIPILFENENFVIVDKPSGWLAVPSQWGDEDPRPVLSLKLNEQLNSTTWPVHRLDLEVTGVTLFGKTDRAHKVAKTWFESREIDKVYEAWGEGPAPTGVTSGDFFEWSSHLHRGKMKSVEAPQGKLAVTRAYWMGSVDFNGLIVQHWHLDPLTGRPHQLRYELSKHGNPILGDTLYGAQSPFIGTTIALRAIRLYFKNCHRARELGLPNSVEAPGLEKIARLKNYF